MFKMPIHKELEHKCALCNRVIFTSRYVHNMDEFEYAKKTCGDDWTEYNVTMYDFVWSHQIATPEDNTPEDDAKIDGILRVCDKCRSSAMKYVENEMDSYTTVNHFFLHIYAQHPEKYVCLYNDEYVSKADFLIKIREEKYQRR